MLNMGKKYYVDKFPNLPHRCPIKPGKYYAENITIFDDNNQDAGSYNITQEFTQGSLANGVYRHVVKLHTEDDPVGFMLYWHLEYYDRLGWKEF